MKSNLYHKLPFEDGDFNFDKFEAFVNALLGSDCELWLGFGEKVKLENLKTTYRYGKQGDNQRGIDIVALTVGGRKIVFQCKYHESKTTRVGLTVARKSVKDAHEKYSDTDVYVLVTNTSFTPQADDHFRENCWGMLGGDELHRAVRSLPTKDGYDLVNRMFGKIAADYFYPLGPHLLISPKRYKSYQTGSLPHQYACIGREKEIKEIVKKLTTKKQSCVIISAEGGIGKSRLMCELLERIESQSEKNDVKILQAESSGEAKQINLADSYDLSVVAVDDAHVTSNLRNDVLKALADSGGHLLLMTRPEGVSSLKNTLARTGWEVPDNNVIDLVSLKKPELIELASEIVENSESRMSEIVSLVDQSSGNALFTVVGAQLINKGHRFKDVVNHGGFRSRVFEALEDNFVNSLKTESKEIQKKVIRTMRVIALFSPVGNDTLKKLGQFLGLTEFELEDHLEYLSQAGLLRRTNDTLRVIPDLFADFVVMELVTDSGSQSIIKQLERTDLMELVGPDVFKNLALAEWLLRQENQTTLLRPLWEGYKVSFEEGNWHEIGKELKNWSNFSFYLPEESMELAELVFLSQKADCFYGKSSAHSNAHDLLVTVCKHSLKYQWEALDLIFKYLDDYSHQSLFADSSGNHPLRSVFHIKTETIHSALDWLDNRLDNDEFISNWINKNNHLVEVCLKGILAKTVENSYSIGYTIHLGTGHVIYENTKELREKGLLIIHKIAFKTVEGALNCINSLESGARWVDGMHGYIDNNKLQKEWSPFRIKCIEILGKIATHWSNSIVHYEVRKSLRQLHWVKEPSPDFESKRIKILDSIEKSQELNLVTLMLSNGYHEFTRGDDEDSEKLWSEFITTTIKELLDEYEGVGVLEYIREIVSEIRLYDYSPSMGHLLSGISKINPELIESMRNCALDGDLLYGDYYLSLAYWLRDMNDMSERDQMLLEGFQKMGSLLLPRILDILATDQNVKLLSSTNEQVIAYIQKAEGKQMDQILEILKNLWSINENRFVYENFNYAGLSAAQIYKISDSLTSDGYNHIKYPSGFLANIIMRMSEISNIARIRVAKLLLKVSDENPKLIYDFVKNDVIKAIDKGDIDELYKVFPYEVLKMRFKNKNEIPDEEIENLFNAYLSADDKPLYEGWLKVVMSANDELSKQLLVKRLETISEKKELDHFLGKELWFDKVTLFNDHKLIGSILSRAKAISSKCLESVIQNLTYLLANTMRSYTNGELDNQDTLERALQYREQVRDDVLLFKFYDAVVKVEREDMARHRAEYERNKLAIDEF